jgi:hypothetical protein
LEHRYGERRLVDLTVLIRKRTWDGWVIGRIRNLSVSGAYIELPRDSLGVLSRVRLELECRGSPGRHRLVHCSGTVVRKECSGIGVAFEDLAPRSLSALWGEA